MPALAIEEVEARPAAACHDAMLAPIAFQQISADDYELLRQPWAAVCLPCPFERAFMFGENSPAANEIFAELRVLPRGRLRAMGTECDRVLEQVWASAMSAVAKAAAGTGFPYRVSMLYWWCVSLVEDTMDEVPTDVAIVPTVHGMAAARLLADRAERSAVAVLEGPYTRARE